MQCPAWSVENLWTLWTGPDLRGQDVVLPLVPGVRPYRRRATTSKRTLELVLSGVQDPEGGTYLDVTVGLEANLALLESLVVAQPATVAGTVAAVLTMPSGAVRSGPVQVLGPVKVGTLTRTGWLCSLDLAIPAGYLPETTPAP